MNPPDTDPRIQDEFDQVIDKLKSANNVLVTISTNPTVDQFAACIGLTLVLNKLGKHANAVFSGKVPAAIDFLKPDKTLEKNTDSLRDFIIALDKSKADKLRYKVEDDIVKIFITPYKTSISEKDLEFSQGDFNVDAVIALGVQDKNHIDTAILSHGRILHDAAVISINVDKQSKLGTINWSDARASSLCEMVTDVAAELDNKVFDSQNSTALLTGIVAETDRYSNNKAAPHTMSIAGLLMAAGASTQLVSSKLELGAKAEADAQAHDSKKKEQLQKEEESGVLEIEHQKDDQPKEEPIDIPEHEDSPPPEEPAPPQPQEPPQSKDNAPKMIHEPPRLGGQLTANTVGEDQRYSGSTDPLSNVPEIPMLTRNDESSSDSLLPVADNTGLAKGKDLPVTDNQTLSDIEKAVDSPHINEDASESTPPPVLDDARNAVMRAQATLNGEDSGPQEPRQDLGSTELPAPKHLGTDDLPPESATLDSAPDFDKLPPPPVEPETMGNSGTNSNSPPPPVPPPLMPTS